jgi:hypothetical protein
MVFVEAVLPTTAKTRDTEIHSDGTASSFRSCVLRLNICDQMQDNQGLYY